MNPLSWFATELPAVLGLSAEALIVCGLLLAAVVLFVSEVLPVDLVALSILAALLLTGLLTPAEGLSGFFLISNQTRSA